MPYCLTCNDRLYIQCDLVITHISPQSTLRPQRDMKEAFSACFATSAVNESRP